MDNEVSQFDILREIPDNDLPALSDLYQNFQSQAPHVYNLLKIGIGWKRKGRNPDNITFYGVDNDWLKSGTFILLMEYSCYDLFLFTLEDDQENLYEALTKTKRIDWTKRTIWFSVASKHIPVLIRLVEEIRPAFCDFLEGSLWALEKEKALQFDIECPDHVYVTKLNKSHARLVNQYWTYKLEGTEEYLATFIEMNSSYGLFLKSDDSLVSWALVNQLGMISNLQTLPEHGRKGYAKMITKLISKCMAEEGLVPVTCIMASNTLSRDFFAKLGFRMYDTCMFVW